MNQLNTTKKTIDLTKMINQTTSHKTTNKNAPHLYDKITNKKNLVLCENHLFKCVNSALPLRNICHFRFFTCNFFFSFRPCNLKISGFGAS